MCIFSVIQRLHARLKDDAQCRYQLKERTVPIKQTPLPNWVNYMKSSYNSY